MEEVVPLDFHSFGFAYVDLQAISVLKTTGPIALPVHHGIPLL